MAPKTVTAQAQCCTKAEAGEGDVREDVVGVRVVTAVVPPGCLRVGISASMGLTPRWSMVVTIARALLRALVLGVLGDVVVVGVGVDDDVVDVVVDVLNGI